MKGEYDDSDYLFELMGLGKGGKVLGTVGDYHIILSNLIFDLFYL